MINRLRAIGITFSTNVSVQKYIIRTHIKYYAQKLGPVDIVLDIGSGAKLPYRPFFQSKKHIGLDYFEATHVNADATHMPIASSVADVVLMTEVLEHLPCPRQTLIETNRLLKEDGHLIVTVPLVWGVHDYIDYQRWTECGLEKILREAGFEVKEIKYRGGIFAVIGCLISTIPMQLFSDMKSQKSWWITAIYVASWLATLPVMWGAYFLDKLDHRQDFTLGYSILCEKSAL